jgi:hypothetical protein
MKRDSILASFRLNVSYSQICVFQAGLESPFNEWLQEHVDQGFSWRPGAVSFRTLESEAETNIEVCTNTEVKPSPKGERIIQVPFHSNGGIEIASITDSRELKLPKGDYNLVFENGIEEGGMWVTLIFISNLTLKAAILRADPELKPKSELLMTAEAAS